MQEKEDKTDVNNYPYFKSPEELRAEGKQVSATYGNAYGMLIDAMDGNYDSDGRQWIFECAMEELGEVNGLNSKEWWSFYNKLFL